MSAPRRPRRGRSSGRGHRHRDVAHSPDHVHTPNRAPHSHLGHPGPIPRHPLHESSDELGDPHARPPLGWLWSILHLDGHSHAHGPIESELAGSKIGLRAVAISFVGLMLTAVMQAVIVSVSGSVGLLADTIHNFGDASTAIPLGIAFWLTRRGSSRRFTYGWGRAEDLAGLFIIVAILFSAGVAAYQSVDKLIQGTVPTHIPWALAAGVIGFVGNEVVAQFRIVVGRRIGSAALVADGYHARVDGLTSLAVVAGLLGVVAGFPIADPIAGLVITAMIVWIVVRNAAPQVLRRMLDAVEPGTTELLQHAARHVPEVREVSEVRARWAGHRLLVELAVALAPTATVAQAAIAADRVRAEIRRHLTHIGHISVEVRPVPASSP